MSKILFTKNGDEVIVDDDIYEELKDIPIYRGGANGSYAKIFKDKKLIYIHRYIMNPPKNMSIDHINLNKFDNRRENLRICTNAENAKNKKRCNFKHKVTETEFKGLFYVKNYGYWKAKVHSDRKVMVDLDLTNEIAAANAYNYYAKKYHGEFAYLNDCNYMDKEEWSKYIVPKIKGERVSRFTNVVWDKESDKWRCTVTWGNNKEEVGRFKDELEASIMVNQCFIENGLLNVIDKKVRNRKLNILTEEEIDELSDDFKEIYQKQLEYLDTIE